MEVIRKEISESHPDYKLLSFIREAIYTKSGGDNNLQVRFPLLVRDAVDFLLDSVRTARTRVKELDNVEKTFIGLKLEHFVRDMLDVPKELRDLKISGIDVDIKNTVSNNWSIPIETYRANEPCLLMIVNDHQFTCSLGLIVAKLEYLHKGVGNRDTKKGVSKSGLENILWLMKDISFPASRFSNIDMERFRELRTIKGGTKRAAQFCRENLNKVIHRDVIEALLFDQLDPMKRLRENGGARDLLKEDGILVLSGISVEDRNIAAQHGFGDLQSDEFLAVRHVSL